jgi:hypothetical protein
MKQELLNLVRERNGAVSFAEIVRECASARGDRTLYCADDPNLVIWMGLSERFVEALEELIAEGRVELVPTSPLVYVSDGLGLNFPLVRGNYKYKTPHWVPALVSLTKGRG